MRKLNRPRGTAPRPRWRTPPLGPEALAHCTHWAGGPGALARGAGGPAHWAGGPSALAQAPRALRTRRRGFSALPLRHGALETAGRPSGAPASAWCGGAGSPQAKDFMRAHCTKGRLAHWGDESGSGALGPSVLAHCGGDTEGAGALEQRGGGPWRTARCSAQSPLVALICAIEIMLKMS